MQRQQSFYMPIRPINQCSDDQPTIGSTVNHFGKVPIGAIEFLALAVSTRPNRGGRSMKERTTSKERYAQAPDEPARGRRRLRHGGAAGFPR